MDYTFEEHEELDKETTIIELETYYKSSKSIIE